MIRGRGWSVLGFQAGPFLISSNKEGNSKYLSFICVCFDLYPKPAFGTITYKTMVWILLTINGWMLQALWECVSPTGMAYAS